MPGHARAAAPEAGHEGERENDPRPAHVALRHAGHCHDEDAALAHLGLRCHPAAVRLDEALDHGEPQPRPVAARMGLTIRIEDPRQGVGGYPHRRCR